MLKQKSFSLWFLSVALLTSLVSGCGSDSNSSSPSASPTPIPTFNPNATPTPTPTSGNQISCYADPFVAGVLVFYVGANGGSFPASNQPYLGTVNNVLSNGKAVVTWSSGTQTMTSIGLLMPTATCTTDISGWAVAYVGTQSASNANFSDSNALYLGKIVRIFAGGYAQINWDHLTYDTVEKFENIAISQQ